MPCQEWINYNLVQVPPWIGCTVGYFDAIYYNLLQKKIRWLFWLSDIDMLSEEYLIQVSRTKIIKLTLIEKFFFYHCIQLGNFYVK